MADNVVEFAGKLDVSKGSGWYHGTVTNPDPPQLHQPKGTGYLRFVNDEYGNPVDRFYEGHWFNGEFDGHGKYATENFVYEGIWLKGKENGYGKKVWKSGDAYEGWFINGQRTGFGTGNSAPGRMKLANSTDDIIGNCTAFTGLWANDECVCGTFYSPNGDWESGEFVRKSAYEYRGKGRTTGHRTAVNGVGVFQGQLFDGEPNWGKRTGSLGTYVGHLENNCFSSSGTFVSPEWVINGCWKQGILDGQCTAMRRTHGPWMWTTYERGICVGPHRPIPIRDGPHLALNGEFAIV